MQYPVPKFTTCVTKFNLVLENVVLESRYFLFTDGDYVKILCYDWSEKLTKEKNWIDHLRIAIAFKEFRNWKRN